MVITGGQQRSHYEYFSKKLPECVREHYGNYCNPLQFIHISWKNGCASFSAFWSIEYVGFLWIG